jgi:hypothetical protein
MNSCSSRREVSVLCEADAMATPVSAGHLRACDGRLHARIVYLSSAARRQIHPWLPKLQAEWRGLSPITLPASACRIRLAVARTNLLSLLLSSLDIYHPIPRSLIFALSSFQSGMRCCHIKQFRAMRQKQFFRLYLAAAWT